MPDRALGVKAALEDFEGNWLNRDQSAAQLTAEAKANDVPDACSDEFWSAYQLTLVALGFAK